MPQFDDNHDWRSLNAERSDPLPAADFKRRSRFVLAGFVLLAAAVLARILWLEKSSGSLLRRNAARTFEQLVSLPAARGRIVTRDEVVLAVDREAPAVALHYRLLEDPPQEAWLRTQARRRLTAQQRRDPSRVVAEVARLRVERIELHRQLAEACEIPLPEWQRRCRQIQRRIERIVRSVERRRRASQQQTQAKPKDEPGVLEASLRSLLQRRSASPVRQPVVIAEQREHHVVHDLLSPAAQSRIEQLAELHFGIRLEVRRRRVYPRQELAANLIGYLGSRPADDPQAELPPRVGKLGLEKAYDDSLQPRPGEAVETRDRRGKVLARQVMRPAVGGAELNLTVDSHLQRTAQLLLAAVRNRRGRLTSGHADSAGGAAIVMDCHTGALLAAASEPTFDPNLFVAGRATEIEAVLHAPGKPLFNRTCRMALPPGSVMKLITAVAILEERVATASETIDCRGYLHNPSALRCRLFVQSGRGHGDISLFGALGQSCNVYFFHHARELRRRQLTDWAREFGLSRPTGIDLPYEARGSLPASENAQGEGEKETAETLQTAIGQGTVTATPMQIARAVAAIANGGRLVRPHVTRASGDQLGEQPRGQSIQSIPALHLATLEHIRRGMVRAVKDPDGTAHRSLHVEGLPVAAKSGTAQAGGGREDHAWIAGFVPADSPRLVFVVVLEHGGSGGDVAGPMARRLLTKLAGLGYLETEPGAPPYK